MAESSPAVFVDRDDTLCKDVPYCSKPEDLELLPGSGEAVKRLNDAGLVVVVVTNQSGIARGWLTEETLASIHEKMKADLAAFEAHVDGIYHCPHHPDEGCECRKPKPWMVARAAEDFDIDVSKSYVVGDRLMDVQLARNVGAHAVLVRSAASAHEFKQAAAYAEHVAVDFAAAVDWILARERK